MELMNRYGMLPNIAAHSVQVKNVAAAIADSLKDGVEINRQLVVAGALLHDIAKTRSILENIPNHDLEGARLLREIGLEEEARICETHVHLKGFDASAPLGENEIVHYADKRVMHDRIVSLDERIEDLILRYGTTEEKIRMLKESKAFLLKLESRLLKFMRVDMETALAGLLRLP